MINLAACQRGIHEIESGYGQIDSSQTVALTFFRRSHKRYFEFGLSNCGQISGETQEESFVWKKLI
jgi:hypothetical protein